MGTTPPLSDWIARLRHSIDRELLISICTIGVILVGWEIASRLALITPQFFPPVTEVLAEFTAMVANNEFQSHFLVSLRRIVISFGLGAILGIAAGVAMGYSRIVKGVLDPFVSILYPIPKVVILPVMFLIFGVGETGRVLTITIGVFLVVAINTMEGVRELDEVYFDAALDNGTSRSQLVREVILPGALPQIFTGLTLGIGLTFILIVLIEMVGADSGLGWLIWDSWENFTITRLYVGILSINFLGIVFVYGTEWVGKVIAPWN